jgi:hypothetical protein
MSKEELQKWKNKFELFVSLHPFDSSHYCREQSEYCKHCNFQINPDIFCGGKYTLMYEFETKNLKYTRGSIPRNGACIEWIRYV